MEFETTVSEWHLLPESFAPKQPLFVWTDIHGCTQAFDRLLAHLPEDALPVFLGDAIDRGPDPIGVLQRLMDLHHNRNALFCRGNHDGLGWFALLKNNPRANWFDTVWENNGGDGTKWAFKKAKDKGLAQADSLTLGPKLFEDYWLTAKNWHLTGNILLVHAGLPEDAGQEFLDMDPIDATSTEDSPFWWRPSWYDTSGYENVRTLNGQNVFVLCGHTPTKTKYSLQNYGIMLDLGYQLKRAVEIRDNRFRTIDTPCDEI